MAVFESLSKLAPTGVPEAHVTSDQFDTMLHDGLLDGIHVELVDGQLVTKIPQNLLHMAAVSAVLRALFAQTPLDLLVVTQGTVKFSENRFEPDVAILQVEGPIGSKRLVDASELRLAIEVAVSSLDYDRGKKVGFYAAGGVPEYWIVNPIARQIEVYRGPVGGKYASVRLVLPGETLDALCLPGATFTADALLPNE